MPKTVTNTYTRYTLVCFWLIVYSLPPLVRSNIAGNDRFSFGRPYILTVQGATKRSSEFWRSVGKKIYDSSNDFLFFFFFFTLSMYTRVIWSFFRCTFKTTTLKLCNFDHNRLPCILDEFRDTTCIQNCYRMLEDLGFWMISIV